MTDEQRERIERERREMGLKAHQFSPSEIDDGPPLYPKGSAGYTAWLEAAAWRREIKARNPHYFADSDE